MGQLFFILSGTEFQLQACVVVKVTLRLSRTAKCFETFGYFKI